MDRPMNVVFVVALQSTVLRLLLCCCSRLFKQLQFPRPVQHEAKFQFAFLRFP